MKILRCLVTLGLIVWTWMVFALGAITHERDICRNLKQSGNAGKAAWTCEIYSSEMKEGDHE